MRRRRSLPVPRPQQPSSNRPSTRSALASPPSRRRCARGRGCARCRRARPTARCPWRAAPTPTAATCGTRLAWGRGASFGTLSSPRHEPRPAPRPAPPWHAAPPPRASSAPPISSRLADAVGGRRGRGRRRGPHPAAAPPWRVALPRGGKAEQARTSARAAGGAARYIVHSGKKKGCHVMNSDIRRRPRLFIYGAACVCMLRATMPASVQAWCYKPCTDGMAPHRTGTTSTAAGTGGGDQRSPLAQGGVEARRGALMSSSSIS